MIDAELAWKFIEQVVNYTDYNINIMNQNGIIIASRDPRRVGTFHEVAYYIVTGTEDVVTVTGENDYPGVRPGINMVLIIDGKREGVVGVSGNPGEIRSVAMIIKMAMEAMVKYENQREELLRRQSRKEQFLNLLTHEPFTDVEMLKDMAKQLNYSEKPIRIPVLCVLEQGNAETILQTLKAGSKHGKQDISFVLDEHRILIFKTMDQSCCEILSDYKFLIADYLSDVLQWLRCQEKTGKFYIGSFQSSFTQYYYGYQHCLWLERNVKNDSRAVFFYDHAGEYLRYVMPMNELQRMFHVYHLLLNEKEKKNYLELMKALMASNYNLVKASEGLFMHKNTFSYRYKKMKDLFNADPMVSSQDRDYMEAFYTYLRKEH